MQTLHQQEELLQVSRWWTDSGLVEELKFARDEIHNWYLCSCACIEDPNLSELRVNITKLTSLIYLIDDVYDVYGNQEQLRLFTEAVCRWDLEATEQLPNCMKICFKTLHDLINETSCKIYQKHGWNPIDSLKKAWASLCTAFLVEAEWFASGKEPSTEEYLNNGIISAGVHVLLICCFFYTGQGLIRKNIQLVESFPPIVSSPATILRLLDDLGSSQKENENADEKDGSYIKVYLQEHPDSSKEKARGHILRMVSKEWKNLNEACVSRHSFPAAFYNVALNSAKLFALIHNYDEHQSLPRPEKLFKSVLFTTWWTDSGLAEELKFARREIHKWYICFCACIEDPNLSELRVDITKFTSLLFLIEDIYDVYGNLEQLRLFTEAVTRWDLEATEQLPNHMKICFKTHAFLPLYHLQPQFLDLGRPRKFSEGECKADGKDGSYMKIYLKENPNSSEEKARGHILSMIGKAWKNLNEACISHHLYPAAFSDAALGSAKKVALFHIYDENQNRPRLEKLVKSVLFATQRIQNHD